MNGVILLVGLGNPGPKYKDSRHNVGFRVIDAVSEKYLVVPKKMTPLVEAVLFSFDGMKIVLAKPQTYMNLSGRAVRFLVDFFKIPLGNVNVFHDDIDLDFAKVKIKQGGGNGGHNGLKSIDSLIGKEYWRVRIGVGRPEYKSEVSSYVLHDFDDFQSDVLKSICAKTADNVPLLLEDRKRFEVLLNHRLKPELHKNVLD